MGRMRQRPVKWKRVERREFVMTRRAKGMNESKIVADLCGHFGFSLHSARKVYFQAICDAAENLSLTTPDQWRAIGIAALEEMLADTSMLHRDRRETIRLLLEAADAMPANKTELAFLKPGGFKGVLMTPDDADAIECDYEVKPALPAADPALPAATPAKELQNVG